MPACFDFSKPVIKPQVSESSSDNETTDNNHNLLDDNHNTIVTSKLSVMSIVHYVCVSVYRLGMVKGMCSTVWLLGTNIDVRIHKLIFDHLQRV